MHESIIGSGEALPVQRPGIREGDPRRDRASLGSSLRRQMAEVRQTGFAGIFDTRHTASFLVRYPSGLAVWIVSFSLRLLMQPLTPDSPFLPFIPGLMLVGWLWSRGPAILYLATTTVVVSIYFVPGTGQFRFDDATHVAAALQFIVIGGAVTYIIEQLVAVRQELSRQLQNVTLLSGQQQRRTIFRQSSRLRRPAKTNALIRSGFGCWCWHVFTTSCA